MTLGNMPYQLLIYVYLVYLSYPIAKFVYVVMEGSYEIGCPCVRSLQ